MSIKKEIGSKLRKKILKSIFAPNIPSTILVENIQFIMQDPSSEKCLLFNRNYEVRFFQYNNLYLPTIQFIRENPSINFPIVKVDEGAVRHILNGADIFAQGITGVSCDFDTNSIVMVSNPKEAILAVGKSIKSSKDLIKSKGKCILNLHNLGDSIWEGKL